MQEPRGKDYLIWGLPPWSRIYVNHFPIYWTSFRHLQNTNKIFSSAYIRSSSSILFSIPLWLYFCLNQRHQLHHSKYQHFKNTSPGLYKDKLYCKCVLCTIRWLENIWPDTNIITFIKTCRLTHFPQKAVGRWGIDSTLNFYEGKVGFLPRASTH